MTERATATIRQVVLATWATLITWGPVAWALQAIGWEPTTEQLDSWAQAIALAVWAAVMAAYYQVTRWVQAQPWAQSGWVAAVVAIFTGSRQVPTSYGQGG